MLGEKVGDEASSTRGVDAHRNLDDPATGLELCGLFREPLQAKQWIFKYFAIKMGLHSHVTEIIRSYFSNFKPKAFVLARPNLQ